MTDAAKKSMYKLTVDNVRQKEISRKTKYIYDGCEKNSGDGKKHGMKWKTRKAMNVKSKPDVTPSFVRTGTVADGNLKKENKKQVLQM